MCVFMAYAASGLESHVEYAGQSLFSDVQYFHSADVHDMGFF